MLNALRRMGYQKHEMSVHSFRSIVFTLFNELGYNRRWIEREFANEDNKASEQPIIMPNIFRR